MNETCYYFWSHSSYSIEYLKTMHEKQNFTPRISDLWILIETNWLGGISKNYESKLEEKFRVRNRNVWIGLAKAQSQLVWWTLYNTPNGALEWWCACTWTLQIMDWSQIGKNMKYCWKFLNLWWILNLSNEKNNGKFARIKWILFFKAWGHQWMMWKLRNDSKFKDIKLCKQVV